MVPGRPREESSSGTRPSKRRPSRSRITREEEAHSMADERRSVEGEPGRAAEKFKAFLVSLATDPAKLGQFIKDPDRTMRAAELSDEEQALLKSGNPAAIYGMLTGQSTPAAAPVTVLVVDLIAESGKEGTGMPSIRSPQTFANY